MNEEIDLKNDLKYAKCWMVNELQVIHYGATCYDPDKVQLVENRHFVKPAGGLWTSPVDSDWGWKQWCEVEEFAECDPDNSFTLCFKADAKILLIEELADLQRLPAVNPVSDLHSQYPDYERLAEHADAIWLTEQGEGSTRLTFPEQSLYGWDCETVFIMNPDCCYQI